MIKLWPLVQNETLKILKKKRFLVVLLVLAVLVPIFTYARMTMAKEQQKQFGTKDWHIQLQSRIYDDQNKLVSPRLPDEWKAWLRVEVEKLQYYLDHDVNPESPNGVTFAREFVSNSISLFIPLLVLAIASDLVSGERSSGTIKMLLARPVRRWKILLAKLLALYLFVSLIIVCTPIVAYAISGLVFGYGGWSEPVFTGFQVKGAQLVETGVHTTPQWLYLVMECGLAWISALAVASLAFMVSVLVRSTAASIVIMMAAIISGSILTNMAQAWKSAKYLFPVNMDLTLYLEGQVPPIPGMSLIFSLAVLAVWAAASLAVSFAVFTRQDMLG